MYFHGSWTQWYGFESNITVIAKVCDRESRRDSWFEKYKIQTDPKFFSMLRQYKNFFFLALVGHFATSEQHCCLSINRERTSFTFCCSFCCRVCGQPYQTMSTG